MTHRIVIATIGSLGDLHPFIAVALALKKRGHEPVLAVPADHVGKCLAAGIPAVEIVPPYQELAARVGLDEATSTRGVMQSPDFLIRQILLPTLGETVATVHAAAADADAVLVSQFAIGAAIAAEARGVPLINGILQPMAILSAHDPPCTPEFAMMVPAPRSQLALGWNRLMASVVRGEMRRRYGPAINAVRRTYGLPDLSGTPLFEHDATPILNLALYSQHLAAPPPDAPPATSAVGFARFDSNSGQPEQLDPALEAFLSAGDAPLVFTLGSFAVMAPGDFYETSLMAARRLGKRSVLLVGPDRPAPPGIGPDTHVAAYAPHSQLFARATAVIHHGGIGTTGQALHAGRPQLIVPHLGDQPDNGARIVRLGVGQCIPAKRYKVEFAVEMLHRILSDEDMGERARALAVPLATEDGARRAAELIEQAVNRTHSLPTA
jgi:rhamnosyltransferase subunit B